ncbi:hypothetical protein MNB_SV-4-1228 [hydrothermal vent metagenome]|uniref:Uncharacterized protein n=1 Tax=hydrothermal vent metagenome TaxID=652676 RepID=A0A1W1E838_9ZZZZ
MRQFFKFFFKKLIIFTVLFLGAHAQNSMLDTIELKVKKVDSTPLKTPYKKLRKQFYSVVFKENVPVAYFSTLEYEKECVWRGGARSFEPQHIIQPIKEKNFYILIYNKQVGVINTDTGDFEKLEGDFLALEDFDKDNLPEIITLDRRFYNNQKIIAYKIINSKNRPKIAILTKHAAFEKNLEGPRHDSDTCIFDEPCIFKFSTFTYDRQNNLVMFDKNIKKDYKNKKNVIAAFNRYFDRWSKKKFRIKQTKLTYHSRKYDDIRRLLEKSDLSRVDKVKISMLSNNRAVCYRLDGKNKRPKLENLFICNGAKGVYKNKNVLAIFDFGYIKQAPNIAYDSINNRKVVYIIGDKYLVVTDLKTRESTYFLWQKILGYKPLMVSYFDGKYLVAVKGQKYGKKEVALYQTNWERSKVEKERW